MFVAGGRGTHVINGRQFEAAKGDFAIIGRGSTHQLFPAENGGEPLDVINCVFTPEFPGLPFSAYPSLRALDSEKSSAVCRFSGREAEEVGALYLRLLDEYREMRRYSRDMLRLGVRQLLIYAARRIPGDASGDGASDRINRASDYLRRHYREKIPLKTLAKTAFLGTSELSRRFHAETGTTLTAFQQQLRIAEACRMLRYTGETVQQIAGEVGYSDMKHFYAVFRRFTGATPTEIRRGTEEAPGS